MKFLLYLSLACLIMACSGRSAGRKAVDRALAAYKATPADSTAQHLYTAVHAFIAENGYADPAAPELLLSGAHTAAERNDHTQALGFYKAYVVEYPDRPDIADRLNEVILIAEAQQKPELNQVLYRLYAARFPKDGRTRGFADKIDNHSVSADSIIRQVGRYMFNDSIFRLDQEKALLYIGLCEAAAMTDPNLPEAPDLLFRAGETARTLRDFAKAINLYDWILEKYPGHSKASVALFLRAFTLDNDLRDFENAGKYYREYLSRYPNGEYAESATFLIGHLGKSEEELRKIIEGGEKAVQ